MIVDLMLRLPLLACKKKVQDELGLHLMLIAAAVVVHTAAGDA